MTKELILKPRAFNRVGEPAWHDKTIIANAIGSIVKGKSMMAMSLWVGISSKIEVEAEANDFGMQRETGEYQKDKNGKPDKNKPIYKMHLPELRVELSNKEAKVFWKHLRKVDFEDFANPGARCSECGESVEYVPTIGKLSLMLTEIAQAFGKPLGEASDDEEDEGEDDYEDTGEDNEE